MHKQNDPQLWLFGAIVLFGAAIAIAAVNMSFSAGAETPRAQNLTARIEALEKSTDERFNAITAVLDDFPEPDTIVTTD